MPLLGNCIIFLETGFFKRYKSTDEGYNTLFNYAKNGGIILCTSSLCLEEWRTQKIRDLENNLRTFRHTISSHQGTNYFSKLLLNTIIFEELDDIAYLTEKSKNIVQEFLEKNSIKNYPPLEKHIDPVWDAYFHGRPPFKGIKNRKDIPDAWIYEAAKNVLETPEHGRYELRYSLSNDNTMSEALQSLGYHPIKLEELLDILHREEAGISQPEINIDSQELELNVQMEKDNVDMTSLNRLLEQVIYKQDSEIYLRLLGYLVAFDSPTHDTLIQAVSSKGYNPRRVEACAVMLSGEPNPYIKDLGTHYIVGDKEVCHAASERVMDEIIGMLE
ncbi:PIN domain-containing protein [Legionella sp. WA2022007384]